jgi:LexA-binding, inner membrane-associated putative hydrolase
MARVFVAHLPAGYIASKLLYRRCNPFEISYPAFMLAGMLGSIVPDIDLAWFYLVDQRQHNHHSYFTHYPSFWLALLAVSCAWYGEAERRGNAALWCNFALNGFIHMFLDSFVGGIRWFAPYLDDSFSLAKVAAVYQPWWLNFLLHWSMLFEGAIILWAFYLWRGPARQWRLR